MEADNIEGALVAKIKSRRIVPLWAWMYIAVLGLGSVVVFLLSAAVFWLISTTGLNEEPIIIPAFFGFKFGLAGFTFALAWLSCRNPWIRALAAHLPPMIFATSFIRALLLLHDFSPTELAHIYKVTAAVFAIVIAFMVVVRFWRDWAIVDVDDFRKRGPVTIMDLLALSLAVALMSTFVVAMKPTSIYFDDPYSVAGLAIAGICTSSTLITGLAICMKPSHRWKKRERIELVLLIFIFGVAGTVSVAGLFITSTAEVVKFVFCMCALTTGTMVSIIPLAILCRRVGLRLSTRQHPVTEPAPDGPARIMASEVI